MKNKTFTLFCLTLLSFNSYSSAVIEKMDQTHFKLKAHFVYYGGSAEAIHAQKITDRMAEIWTTNIRDCPVNYKAEFTSEVIQDEANLKERLKKNGENPLNNFVRLEKNNKLNVSFFTLSGNTGMIVDKDLPEVSTTPAHEFGHSLGLDHPKADQYLKNEYPGLMFPRGTIVFNGYGRDDQEISKYLGKAYQGLDPMKRELKCFENLAVYRAIKLNKTNKTNKKSNLGQADNEFLLDNGDTEFERQLENLRKAYFEKITTVDPNLMLENPQYESCILSNKQNQDALFKTRTAPKLPGFFETEIGYTQNGVTVSIASTRSGTQGFISNYDKRVAVSGSETTFRLDVFNNATNITKVFCDEVLKNSKQ